MRAVQEGSSGHWLHQMLVSVSGRMSSVQHIVWSHSLRCWPRTTSRHVLLPMLVVLCLPRHLKTSQALRLIVGPHAASTCSGARPASPSMQASTGVLAAGEQLSSGHMGGTYTLHPRPCPPAEDLGLYPGSWQQLSTARDQLEQHSWTCAALPAPRILTVLGHLVAFIIVFVWECRLNASSVLPSHSASMLFCDSEDPWTPVAPRPGTCR